MNELSELPFEKVLSYLSLEELIKARRVSRTWRNKIDNFRVKSLCLSKHPIGFISGKNRWVTGAFAQNFVSSTEFEPFFDAFAESILSNLKRLRFCDVRIEAHYGFDFEGVLSSFGQLEELDIISFSYSHVCSPGNVLEFELSLPMLNSIRLERVNGFSKLTLDAPKLKKIQVAHCPYTLDIIYEQSVEWLAMYRKEYVEVKNLKNLKYLYLGGDLEIDSTSLSGLKQLKKIHLDYGSDDDRESVQGLFKLKQRYGRSDLKVYFYGLLLTGPDDPAIASLSADFEEVFVYLAENPTKLADEIPLYQQLFYANIERVAPGLVINLMNRLTDLKMICVNRPVQDIQRFLDLLKKFGNIDELQFSGTQPQDLFDRLPEHCAVQSLVICGEVSDFRFLFRLEHLIYLILDWAVDVEFIRKAFAELPFTIRFMNFFTLF